MNNKYQTCDLNLATTLIYFWYPIQDINKSNTSRIEFIFNDTERLSDILDKYYRKQLQVEPISFLSNLKLLKQRIYQLQTS